MMFLCSRLRIEQILLGVGMLLMYRIFWDLIGELVVRSLNADVWLLGEGASNRNHALLSLEAPNFTLADIDGTFHSLTDFRGNRVFASS